MAVKFLGLQLLACLAALSVVAAERTSAVDILVNMMKDAMPCTQPCLLENYDAYMKVFQEKCQPIMTQFAERIGGSPSAGQPPDVYGFLNHPAQICELIDSMSDCTEDVIGQFCGRDLTNYINDKVMKPFRSYLSCDNEGVPTLLKCLSHPSSNVTHALCTRNAASTWNSQREGASDYQTVYNQYLADPKANLCPLTKDFIKCENNNLKKETTICPDNVIADFDFETSAIVDTFICNTSPQMDALPCLADPWLHTKLEKECVPAVTTAIGKLAQTIPPERLSSEITRLFLARDGPMKGFLLCVKGSLRSSLKCQPSGWSVMMLNRIADPFLAFIDNANEYGHCNCQFPDYPHGECNASSGFAVSPSRMLAVFQGAVLLLVSRRFLSS